MNVVLKKNSVVIIDAMNLLHRSYYAYPNLISKNNEPTGALFGFIQYLRGIEKLKPMSLIICSDAHRYNFRNEIYPNYKGTRKETELDLKSQITLMEEYIKIAGIPFIKKNNFEADDLIGTLAKIGKANGQNVYIYSGDTDLCQLVDEDVTQLYLGNKGVVNLDVNGVVEKFEGLYPRHIIDYKALMGDTSDNIPGVDGIGKVGARKLLLEYENLDGIYENIELIKGKTRDNLINGKELAYLSQRLAIIERDVDIDSDSLFYPTTKYQLSFRSAVEFLRDLDIKLFKNEEIIEDVIDIGKNETIQLPFDIKEDMDGNLWFNGLFKYPGCVSKEGLGIYLFSLLFDINKKDELKSLIGIAKINLINEFEQNIETINKIEPKYKELINFLDSPVIH